MADTTQRSGASSPPADPSGRRLDCLPDRLPFARAASVFAVVLLAGGLFGYDQGVISGALVGIQKAFAVGAVALEIVTSWVTLGALFGSLAGGYVADHFGRKRALFAAAGLFIIGAAVEAFAPGVPVLVFGRLVAGFGVGVAAVAAPLYAAELAPAAQRLSGRRGARGPERLARHVRGLGYRWGSALARRSDRSRVPALVRQGRPA